eukprot:GHVS01009074.1.p1 GENE.GHVS01009074.1~~GHVS01009074.1.p1  ORF type:complete len:114 (-),score=23.93 GHVS01009074.1:36-377(-)
MPLLLAAVGVVVVVAINEGDSCCLRSSCGVVAYDRLPLGGVVVVVRHVWLGEAGAVESAVPQQPWGGCCYCWYNSAAVVVVSVGRTFTLFVHMHLQPVVYMYAHKASNFVNML